MIRPTEVVLGVMLLVRLQSYSLAIPSLKQQLSQSNSRIFERSVKNDSAKSI
jgi:hypothetical protein